MGIETKCEKCPWSDGDGNGGKKGSTNGKMIHFTYFFSPAHIHALEEILGEGKEIVERMGESIEIEGRLGEG